MSKKTETTPPAAKAARPAGRADHAGRPFEKFLRTLTSALVLFRWAGDLFVTVLMQPGTRTLSLEGQEFKDWVSGRLYAAKLRGMTDRQWEAWLAPLRAEARHGRLVYPVSLRVAPREGGGLWINLGTDQYVEVTATGWHVRDTTPVRFLRPGTMLPLPVPVRGGSIAALRPFVNTTEHGFHLAVAFVLACFNLEGSYPLLELQGGQGTGKSTMTELLRRLIDPSSITRRGVAVKEEQVALAARQHHLLTMDNVSYVSPEMSDVLCRVSTGGTFEKRKLYTDDGLVVMSLKRPCILNGIGTQVHRSDLLDRTWSLEVQRMPADKRLPERVLAERVEAALPGIFGAVCDGLVTAVRDVDHVTLKESGRLADAEQWVTAAEPGLGLRPGTLTRAIHLSREDAIRRALEEYPAFWAAMQRLARQQWEGSMADLQRETAMEHKTPQQVGQLLSRLGPVMERAGVRVEEQKQGHAWTKRYWVKTVTGMVGMVGMEDDDVA
jgi:putative DNA primase/helicase